MYRVCTYDKKHIQMHTMCHECCSIIRFNLSEEEVERLWFEVDDTDVYVTSHFINCPNCGAKIYTKTNSSLFCGDNYLTNEQICSIDKNFPLIDN